MTAKPFKLSELFNSYPAARTLVALASTFALAATAFAAFDWMPPEAESDTRRAVETEQIVPRITVTPTPRPTANSAAYQKEYVIDLAKFGISNDGTHAAETSKGLNAALQHAKELGANRIVFPAGAYLVSETDPIVLDHKNTIIDLNGSTLQIQANGLPKYAVVEIVNGAENLRFTNGTLRGDRDAHDYKMQPGTHEWGAGLHVVSGIGLEIDHLTMTGCTGDGVSTNVIGHRTRPEMLAMIFHSVERKHLEPGAFSDQGEKIPSKEKTRTKIPFDLSKCGAEFEFGYVAGLMGYPFIKSRVYQICFLDGEGRFLEKRKVLQYRKVKIPPGATSAHFEFNQPEVDEEPAHAGAAKGGWVARITNFRPPRDVHFHHNILDRNRRLGMAYTGGQRWVIEENRFENNGGTNPAYGVDFEDGSELLQDVVFRQNSFKGNRGGDLVVCAGSELSFEDNVFEKSVVTWGRVHNYAFRRNTFLGGTVHYCTRTGVATIEGNIYRHCKLSIRFDTKAVADGLVRDPGKTVATPPLLLSGEKLEQVEEVAGTYVNFKNSTFKSTKFVAGKETRLVRFEHSSFEDSGIDFEEKGPVVSFQWRANRGDLPASGPGQERKRAVASPRESGAGDSIGVATMQEDGTIILQLRAEDPGGVRGEGRFVYAPSHRDYQIILDHVAPLKKGETVQVKPWPDKK